MFKKGSAFCPGGALLSDRLRPLRLFAPALLGLVIQMSGMITIKITADSQNTSFRPSIEACALNCVSKKVCALKTLACSVV